MPETKTGTPARGRTRNTAAKTATKTPTRAATKPAAPKTDEANVAKVGPIELVFTNETKSYAVFKPPAGSGCVGSFYAPPGTTEVKVMLYGPAEALDAVEA